MEEKIIEIILEVCDDETLKNNLDIDLIENDILDSLSFITLIERIEDEFKIELQPTQIPANTWRKISSIVEYVKSKLN